MTAPTCGARTVDLGSPTSCHLAPGHEGNHEDGCIGWVGDHCPILITGDTYTTPEGAALLIASLQRQLAGLDPNSAVAEAEQRMVEAWRHLVSLRDMSRETGPGAERDDLYKAVGICFQAWVDARKAWQALFEKRLVPKDGRA